METIDDKLLKALVPSFILAFSILAFFYSIIFSREYITYFTIGFLASFGLFIIFVWYRLVTSKLYIVPKQVPVTVRLKYMGEEIIEVSPIKIAGLENWKSQNSRGNYAIQGCF